MMRTSLSMPRMDARDMDEERDVWDESDESEDQGVERAEAINKLISEMTDEQRERFDLFRSANCKPPQKRILEMMKQSVPDSVTVQGLAALVGVQAAKLFMTDLLETARVISGNDDPITPDLIFAAYNEMENAGKIPGKGSGFKRSFIR